MNSLRRHYGSSPLHLVLMLGCFAGAGYAALRASGGPLPIRMAVWFLGAAVGHDLVLFPLYSLADRLLPRRRATNYLRVPALLSGLMLLVFWPSITGHANPAYTAASGLTDAPFLGRWLLLSAVLFAGSAACAVLARVRTH